VFTTAARFSGRFVVCLIAFAALLFVLATLHPIVVPVAFALLLSAALTPLVQSLESHGTRPALAAIVASLAITSLFLILGFLLFFTVLRDWEAVAQSFTTGLSRVGNAIQSTGLSSSQVDAASQGVEATWQTTAPILLDGLVRFATSGIVLVAELLLALLLVFYFLLGGHGIWEWWLAGISRTQVERVDSIARRCWTAVAGYMLGTLIVGLGDGAMIAVGLWLLGVPYAFSLGVLTIFAEFIPLIGPTVMGIVAVIVAFGHGGLRDALIAALIIWPVQQFNGHVTAPLVYGRTIEISPLVVLLAILTGGILAGMLGMLVAVPVAGVLSIIIEELRRRHSKGTEYAAPTRTRLVGHRARGRG
jgi:predicted PurR-regulated permease PerM